MARPSAGWRNARIVRPSAASLRARACRARSASGRGVRYVILGAIFQGSDALAGGKDRWLPAADDIASAVQSLPDLYYVAFSDYNYATAS